MHRARILYRSASTADYQRRQGFVDDHGTYPLRISLSLVPIAGGTANEPGFGLLYPDYVLGGRRVLRTTRVGSGPPRPSCSDDVGALPGQARLPSSAPPIVALVVLWRWFDAHVILRRAIEQHSVQLDQVA